MHVLRTSITCNYEHRYCRHHFYMQAATNITRVSTVRLKERKQHISALLDVRTCKPSISE